MKGNTLWAIGFLLGLLFATSSAHPSPLDCESIRDPDERNFCRAVSKNDKTYCEFIKNHDRRFECRARIK